MALATHEQLNAEVDRQFREEHPDAPHRLDPHDSAQHHFVTAWTKIRDETVSLWTSHYLKQFYPTAPDPFDTNDPAAHDFIEYWNDIHHQILTGEPGRWSWDSPPEHAQAQSNAAAEHQGAASAADAGGSGWVYADLRVRSVAFNRDPLIGYETFAQPVGSSEWYSTVASTSDGRDDANFRNVLVNPQQGMLLRFVASETGLVPTLEGVFGCEDIEQDSNGCLIRIRAYQDVQVVTVAASSTEEAIQQVGGSYPRSVHIRDGADAAGGETHNFQVLVGQPGMIPQESTLA